MAHDVFISYSKHDKPAADAVCAKLESRGIRCWTAPRDIRPGMSWGGAIVEAIDGARVMLLLFSSHANGSPQIMREVERAVHKGIVVVPVRVEDINPTSDFAYFLGTPHWLDAITPPFEQYLDRIADAAKFWLKSDAPRSKAPTGPVRAETAASRGAIASAPGVPRKLPNWRRIKMPALVIAAFASAAAAFFWTRNYLAATHSSETSTISQPMTTTPASDSTPTATNQSVTKSEVPSPAARVPGTSEVSTSAAPDGATDLPRDPEFMSYFQTVQRKIKQAWTFPGDDPDLNATVNFGIGPSGDVTKLQITKGSGDGVFDDSVVRAIRRAAPFPQPPEKFRTQFSDGVDAVFQLGDLRS
jgi:TonB family protein